MSKKRKNRKLQTLPVDLSEMAGTPVEALKAHAEEALHASVEAFDTATGANFVFSGKDAAPMGSHIDAKKDGLTLQLFVASSPMSTSALDVSPNLSVSTTGKNRRPVRVTGKKSHVVEVPRGFIWNGSIFRRIKGRKITKASSFLVKSGADPSPALALGNSSDAVSGAGLQILSGAVDDDLSKNGE